MVSINFLDIISELRERIYQEQGLELAFYEYVKNGFVTLSESNFTYEDHIVAFKGFAGVDVSDQTLNAVFQKKRPKGIGYSSNIFCFSGIHLAAKGKKQGCN